MYFDEEMFYTSPDYFEEPFESMEIVPKLGVDKEADAFLEVALRDYSLEFEEEKQLKASDKSLFDDNYFNRNDIMDKCDNEEPMSCFDCPLWTGLYHADFATKCFSIVDKLLLSGYFAENRIIFNAFYNLEDQIVKEVRDNATLVGCEREHFFARDLYCSETFCRLIKYCTEVKLCEDLFQASRTLSLVDRSRELEIGKSVVHELKLVVLKRRLSIVAAEIERDMSHITNLKRRQSFDESKNQVADKLSIVLGKKLILFLQSVKQKTAPLKKRKASKWRDRKQSKSRLTKRETKRKTSRKPRRKGLKMMLRAKSR